MEALPDAESADVAEFPALYPGTPSDRLIVRKESRSVPLPALISDAGDEAKWRFIEFFVATIRKNTFAGLITPKFLESWDCCSY
jgi:hypothetical protein